MRKDAGYWKQRFGLLRHPEGGFFAPAYRSHELIGKKCLPDRFPGDRSTISSIYYLIEKERFSAFHRIKSVEIWHYCSGSPLLLHSIDLKGDFSTVKLGKDSEDAQIFMAAVEPGCWFAAEVAGRGKYSLVSCIVAPGFDYEDFELARRDELTALYPRHRQIIERLTRD